MMTHPLDHLSNTSRRRNVHLAVFALASGFHSRDLSSAYAIVVQYLLLRLRVAIAFKL